MDSTKFAEKQIRVGGTTGVEPVLIEYQNDDYNWIFNSDKKAIEDKNGYLLIAELFSNDDKLPRFKFRWDHKASTMDVDIFLNGKDCKDLWKQNGYCGHWTELTDDEKREYSVSLEIPERKIFVGTIMVGLLVDLNLHDNLSIREDIKIEIK